MLAQLGDGRELSGQNKPFISKRPWACPSKSPETSRKSAATVDEAGFSAAEAEHARISGGGQAMGEIETGEFYRQLLLICNRTGQLPDWAASPTIPIPMRAPTARCSP